MLCIANNFDAIFEELALEEPVHQEELTEHVEEAEELAEEVPGSSVKRLGREVRSMERFGQEKRRSQLKRRFIKLRGQPQIEIAKMKLKPESRPTCTRTSCGVGDACTGSHSVCCAYGRALRPRAWRAAYLGSEEERWLEVSVGAEIVNLNFRLRTSESEASEFPIPMCINYFPFFGKVLQRFLRGRFL